MYWYTLLITVLLIALAWLSSNIIYKLTGNFVFSRKSAHGFIGLLVLLSWYLYRGPTIPILICIGAMILFTLTNQKETFYGIQKRTRKSEIYFALSLSLCFLSWEFVDPWVGIAAGLFMAWGDGITGLVRYPFYKTQYEKGWAGSVAMLLSCLVIAVLVQPYWVGAVGAVVATYLERQTWFDDNLTAPLGSLAAMTILLLVV